MRAPGRLSTLATAMRGALVRRRAAEAAQPPTVHYQPAPEALGRRGLPPTAPIPATGPAGPGESAPQADSPALAPVPHEHAGAPPPETPQPASVADLEAVDERDEGSLLARIRAWIRRYFANLPTTDGGVNTTLARAPRVDLRGQADPGQMAGVNAGGQRRIAAGAARSADERSADYGENDLGPDEGPETITRPLPGRSQDPERRCPQADSFESLSFDPEDQAELEGRVRPQLAGDYAAHSRRLGDAERQRDSGVDRARADGARDLAAQQELTHGRQLRQVAEAQGEVARLRHQWSERDSGMVEAYDGESGRELRRADREVGGHVAQEQGLVDGEQARVQQQAREADRQARRESEQARQQGQQRSRSLASRIGSWIKNKVRQAARWVSEKIHQIFKALRDRIRKWFNDFKAWALRKIEQARRWVINRLEDFRRWAHRMVDRYLSRFPQVARFFKRAIDRGVQFAKRGVNAAASALKRTVSFIIDTMARAVDAALALVERAAQFVVWSACNLAVLGVNLVVLAVDRDLDAVIELVRDLPEPDILGPLWPAVKYALLGFLERVRDKPADVKKRYARKTFRMLFSPSYFVGVLAGVIKGFVWDGLVGTVRMLYDIVVGIPKALAAVYRFFRSRLEDIESITAIVEEAHGVWNQLRAFMARGDATARIAQLLRRSPGILHAMVRSLFQRIRAWAYDAGAKAADQLFSFILNSSMFDIGLKVGTVVGQVIFEVVLLVFTSGAGTLIKWGGKALQVLARAGRWLTSAARGGTVILRALNALRQVAIRGIRLARRVAASLRGVFVRLERLVNRIFQWFRGGVSRLRRPRAPRLPRRPAAPRGRSPRRRRPRRRDRGEAIFQRYKRQVNLALQRYRVRGIAHHTLVEILRLYRRSARVRRVVVRPQITPAARHRYRATVLARTRVPRLRRVATVKRLPTGLSRGEAIGMHWYKAVSWYPASVALNPVARRWTRGRTPPPASSMSRTGATPVEVPPTQYRSFPFARVGPQGRRFVVLGVAAGFLPRVGKVVRRFRSGGVRRPMQGRFRTLLRNYGFAWGSREADHVQDIAWGGLRVDRLRNLWPLEGSLNRAGNAVYQQPVAYQDRGQPRSSTPGSLIGRWFRIRSLSR